MTTEVAERTTCKACGGKTDDDEPVCGECEELGLNAEMTTQAMLKHMIERAARVDYELQELEDQHEGDDELLKAVEAWHKARSVVCKDDKWLANTQEDLLDTSRWYFASH
jgi:hypothetical protein